MKDLAAFLIILYFSDILIAVILTVLMSPWLLLRAAFRFILKPSARAKLLPPVKWRIEVAQAARSDRHATSRPPYQ